jgi:SAM-dependent MidA family methyltransferase
VRRLTLPAEMGERFQVMALSRGLDENISENLKGFSYSDLRHSL